MDDQEYPGYVSHRQVEYWISRADSWELGSVLAMIVRRAAKLDISTTLLSDLATVLQERKDADH